MPRPSRLLVALLVAGGLAAAVDAARRAPHRADPAAGWAIVDPDGAEDGTRDGGAVRLDPDRSLATGIGEDGTLKARTVRIVATPLHLGASLELRWVAPNGQERVASIAARRVSIGHRRWADTPWVETAAADVAPGTSHFDVGRNVTVDVRFRGGTMAVALDDAEVLAAPSHVTPGRFLVTARERAFTLSGLFVEGTAGAGEAEHPVSFSSDLSRSLPPARLGAAARRLLVCVLVALLAAAFLRTIVAGRPAAGELATATARWLAPAALVTALSVALGAAPSAVPIAVASGLGLLPALFTVRAHLKASALEPLPAALPALAAVALAVSAWAAAGWTYRFHEEERRDEERAIRAPAPRPWTFDRDEAPLGPDDAVLADASWRDLDLTARVSIEPGGIVQLRVRAARDGKPYGVALFLSTDPRFESGFFEEGRVRFSRIGAAAGAVPAGRPLDVRVEARGRRFRASIDDRVFAMGSCRRQASGGITILAARGRGTLLAARAAPARGAGRADPAGAADAATAAARSDALRGAAVPASFLVLFALLLRRRGRVPFSRPVAGGALALLPLALTLPHLSPSGPLELGPLGAGLASSAALLLLLPTVQAPAVGRLRRVGALLLVPVAGVLLVDALLERAWPPTANERNAIAVDAWEGKRLEADLIHFTHPLLRRWHRYLGDHRLRGRDVPLAPRSDLPRVLFLGTSSTYGYRVRIPYGFHVERALARDGRPAEVLVGAIEGSSGARLFHVLRNSLAEYRPDVVCLSLGFNDSIVLAQADERAYLERVTADGYRRGLLDRVATRLRLWIASRRLASAMRRASAEAFDALGAEGDRPAERFERILRDFAAFTAERGVDLVLVKEPFDRSRMSGLRPQAHFAGRFHAAADRVADEYGLRTVDPAPYLAANGGSELFMDAVHPTEHGHEVMARAILPTLEEVLARRAERD